MKKKILIANWKDNPDSLEGAVFLTRLIESAASKNQEVEVVIAPPFPFLIPVKKAIKKAKLGSQDLFWEDVGPYTGEVSPRQLKSLSVSYVIVGHSERRQIIHETDKIINKKLKAAIKTGLKVILCVGEKLKIRKKGINSAKNFVSKQLNKGLAGVKKSLIQKNVLIAYEPVWAIGTGRADNQKNASEMARFIKSIFKVKVLYGGSVTAKNANEFLQNKEIDGALVGGASLKPKEFLKIIKAASK